MWRLNIPLSDFFFFSFSLILFEDFQSAVYMGLIQYVPVFMFSVMSDQDSNVIAACFFQLPVSEAAYFMKHFPGCF